MFTLRLLRYSYLIKLIIGWYQFSIPGVRWNNRNQRYTRSRFYSRPITLFHVQLAVRVAMYFKWKPPLYWSPQKHLPGPAVEPYYHPAALRSTKFYQDLMKHTSLTVVIIFTCLCKFHVGQRVIINPLLVQYILNLTNLAIQPLINKLKQMTILLELLFSSFL